MRRRSEKAQFQQALRELEFGIFQLEQLSRESKDNTGWFSWFSSSAANNAKVKRENLLQQFETLDAQRQSLANDGDAVLTETLLKRFDMVAQNLHPSNAGAARSALTPSSD